MSDVMLKTAVRCAVLSLAALLLGIATGCGNGSAAVPSDDIARNALESALKVWQGGGKPGKLAGTTPPVEVYDTPWQQGAKLGSFEILQGESKGVEKWFTVRLELAKPAGVQEVKYYVLGQGPVMIVRDEDYERNTNMVDGPKVKAGAQSKRGKR